MKCYENQRILHDAISYLTCLSLISPHRESRVLGSSTSDLLSTQSSSTNIAARWFSCCVPAVWNSLHSFVRTADSFTIVLGRSSRLTCSQAICSQSTVCDSDTLTRSFARYKFVTYLLNLFVAFVFSRLLLSDEESSKTGPTMILTSSTRERPASLHATVSRCRKRRSGFDSGSYPLRNSCMDVDRGRLTPKARRACAQHRGCHVVDKRRYTR